MVSETEITVRGRLGQNPELQVSQSGKQWLRLRVATNRRVRNGDVWADGPTSWYDVKVWGDFAQNVAQSLRKGDAVIVQGALEIDEYVGGNGVALRTAVIHANALGPDLRGVTAHVTRVNRAPAELTGSAVDVSNMQVIGDDVTAAARVEEDRAADLADDEDPFDDDDPLDEDDPRVLSPV